MSASVFHELRQLEVTFEVTFSNYIMTAEQAESHVG